MVSAAALELKGTNVRVNEAFLSARVDYDEVAEQKGDVMKASDYGKLYERILENEDLKGCRISVFGPKDLDASNVRKKSEWKV